MTRKGVIAKGAIGLLVFVFGAGLLFAPNALALNKEDLIKKAYQEMLDRDPSATELESQLESFISYDVLKSSLNQSGDRGTLINDIYMRSLKRMPQDSERDWQISTGNPVNNIREQLYTSTERGLAIDDAYRNVLNRLPQDYEKEFLTTARVSLDVQQAYLTTTPERDLMIDNLAENYLGREAGDGEMTMFNGYKPLRGGDFDYYYGHDIEQFYFYEKAKSENVVYVDDNNWGSGADGTENNPYHSIETAVANITAPGTIYLKAGEYGENNENQLPDYVDLKGIGADEVLISGSMIKAGNYSTIANIHINFASWGIWVWEKNVVIQDNIIDDSMNSGIFLTGSNGIIENNTVINNNTHDIEVGDASKAVLINNTTGD